MSDVIQIIHLEDIRSDAEIIRRELTKGGLSFNLKWVTSKDSFVSALSEFRPDIVLSDHSLPGFTSSESFRLLQKSGLNIPFILITATVSEEFAVTMMKEGIADYLLKDRLQRLPVAVTNALEKWEAEREKINSHEMLVQSERRFRGLIENSHDMIVVYDGNLKPVFASSSYTRLTGRTLEERRNIGKIDLIYPDDRNEFYNIVNTAKREPRKYFPMLYRLLHKDGKYIWVEGTVINMLDDEAIGGILFNLRDITARVQTEESLRKSQANLSAVIENSNVSIYSIDRQFKYLSFNDLLRKNLRQVYGLEVKAGDHVFDFLNRLDPDEINEWKDIYTEAFSGNRVEFEKEFKYGDYHSFTSFSINPIVEGDYVTGLSCFAWDITPQKMAAIKVSQSEARFRALIENNFDAIVLRDENRKVMYASPSVSRMLGSQGEKFGETGEVMIHPDDLPFVARAYEDVLKNENVPSSMSIRVKHKNGHYLWTEGVMTNMLNNENVRGIVSNFRDVTERKEAELQREKITLDLVERNKNLEQYAYIVSHNLRAPVANILGISHVLELGGITEADGKQALQHLFASTQRLDEVIKDLNMILSMRQGINEKKEDIIFQDIVDDIKSIIQPLITKSDVNITCDFTIPSIASVKSYVYSIFYNLITNGIKYRRSNVQSIICISSSEASGRVRLTFGDNGLGLDLNAQGANVFGLYKRFHPAHAEGKGMGLFMTKTQVEALGGKISVTSAVNHGTEFTIEL
ncbi:MAG TPA: PAS domain S-box protein [Cyclobacteriaceae bacterium]|nr:PAS domain S-box protein [Cyclobacteriaceae bacterium]